MRRAYSILPPWSPPWRYDLYQALFSALLVAPNANRGEGRARELHNQALLIQEKTGEEMPRLMWALATLESAMNTSAAEEESFPSSHSSPQWKPSRQNTLFAASIPKTRNPSSQSSHSELWG